MTKNNLKLLDQDEHLRPQMTKAHAGLIEFAQQYDLIVDCATSDVVVYLEDELGDRICLG